MILLTKFIIRLFSAATAFYLLTLIDKLFQFNLLNLYNFLSATFYFLFFVFIEWYINSISKEGMIHVLLKWLNILKWIPLCFVLILISLSFQIHSPLWPQSAAERFIFSYKTVWPVVFVPNLSFIIITLLIFYSAAILKRNTDLKQENDLTI